MPQYGLIQYGLFQYGRYNLLSDQNYKPELQPRLRMRMRTADGGIGIWGETQTLMQMLPGKFPQIRIKTNAGEWVYTQSVEVPHHLSKIRVRARGENVGPWVMYEEAQIKKEG